MGLVSAFTAGHSLTLALAALGFVHVPAAPVEAAIALSVAFLAREALREGEDTLRHGAALVFGFGLLHGLGFASALQASGIARAEFYVGLLTFNLGVEIGQLMFVALVVGLAAAGHLAGMAHRAASDDLRGRGVCGGSAWRVLDAAANAVTAYRAFQTHPHPRTLNALRVKTTKTKNLLFFVNS